MSTKLVISAQSYYPLPHILLSINSKKDAVSDLGTENIEAVFDSLFKKAFSNAPHIDSVIFYKKNIELPLYKRTLVLPDGDTVTIALPKDSVIVVCDSIRAEYVLFLSKTSAEYSHIPSQWTGNPMHSGFGGGLGVSIISDYAIWDNGKGKIVVFGRLKTGGYYKMVYGIEDFVLELRYSSPFKYKE
jgi:hypothetical protein